MMPFYIGDTDQQWYNVGEDYRSYEYKVGGGVGQWDTSWGEPQSQIRYLP